MYNHPKAKINRLRQFLIKIQPKKNNNKYNFKDSD